MATTRAEIVADTRLGKVCRGAFYGHLTPLTVTTRTAAGWHVCAGAIEGSVASARAAGTISCEPSPGQFVVKWYGKT